MAVGQHLKLRCFLEGIEIPIISADLQVQPDAPSQCTIQIPATDKAHEFRPRTLVHVFFSDFYDGPSDTASINVGDSPQVGTAEEQADRSIEEEVEEAADNSAPATITAEDIEPTEDIFGEDGPPGPLGSTARVDDREIDQGDGEATDQSEDRKWKLFFCGEMIGYQFQKSHSSRAIILTCLDLSVYWDTCYQYQVNVASLHGNATAHFVGAGTTLFDTFFSSATSTIIDVVRRRSRARPELTGLLSGVVHLLERVGGVYNSRGFRGVNDFFTMAELKYHLIDMIAASETDNSSQRLFPRRAFNRFTRGSGGRLGKIASFREILNLLNRFIFHNTVPNPIARYETPQQYQRTRRRTSSRERSVDFSSTSEGRTLTDEIRTHHAAFTRYIGTSQRFRRNGLSSQLNRLASGIRSTKIRAQNTNTEVDLSSIINHLHHAGRIINRLSTNLHSYEHTSINPPNGVPVDIEPTYILFFQRNQSEAADALGRLGAAYDEISGRTVNRTRSSTTQYQEDVTISGRLYSQIIRPDIFMCAPPRCNVLFPELYSQVSFSRQFLREVTRMRLTVSDEIFGPDCLLDNVYYAPDVEVLGARVRQARRQNREGMEGPTLRRAAYARRLMDHELYTGPVPVFERMNEVNMVAARGQSTHYRGARVPFVTRAAEFQFFKNRWGSRTMQVMGKFNPWAVCGFPAVVMDRYMNEGQVALSGLRGMRFLEELAEANYPGVVRGEDGILMPGEEWGALTAWDILRNTVPHQFVGLVMGLQHSISQGSASTSYTLSSARIHRDNDVLLNSNRVRVSQRREGEDSVNSTVASLEGDPPRVGQLGPNHGLITAVEQLEQNSGSYLLYGTFRSRGPRRYDVEVTVGVSQRAEAYGPEVVTIVGSDATEVTFRAYQVTEDVEAYNRDVVDVPIEDILRPPWMSNDWSNPRIGAIYQQFFGIGAITDPVTIDTGMESATPTADARQAQAEAEALNTNVQDPIRQDGQTVQEAEMAISIERAIDLLVRSYSAIKLQSEMDVNEFIRAYTWRPVADLIDMLGTRDLTIDANTGEVSPSAESEGFHSRAFGHGENGRNLRNLLPPDSEGRPVRRILGIDTREGSDRQGALTLIDKRADKADKVLAYVEELWQSRGQLG
jgi:hypothetical protein